ncbi:MAG: gamma-glutamyltranspeptidase precursor (Gamma-glutamyltransferase)-like protein, partial [Paucimonas sp.]|nr:gamma-glutamyltranspeptidase precursor (Gamma-glutamyltransferase)-like protein [Paucimonas sp.]
SMQAQGHVQVASRVADFGQNPQATSDAPRWRVMDDNSTVAVEWNFPPAVIEGLRQMGHKVQVAQRFDTEFGCAQFAMKTGEGYIAASDHRKDGYPVGM